MALLEDGLKAVGIEEEKIPALAEKMEKYIAEIALCNSAFNLTNTSDHDELVTRHILDSLAAYVPIRDFLKERAADGTSSVTVGDIGSGGGLPGLPLAAVFPQYSFTLVERMSKRCGFLEKTAATLGLSNVTVLEQQVEFVPQKSFDLVTFRAFRPLDLKMAKNCCVFVKRAEFLRLTRQRWKILLPKWKELKSWCRNIRLLSFMFRDLKTAKEIW